MKNTNEKICVILDPSLGSPATYGAEQLLDALKEHQVAVKFLSSRPDNQCGYEIIIAVGLSDWDLLEKITHRNFGLPRHQESLLVKRISWKGKRVILIIGSDNKGVMYATLEAARTLRLLEPRGSVFQEIKETSECPYVPVRGICMFLHSEDLEKEWYYSERFWRKYFHMLAENRFNSFNLVFAHQTYYLAPPYPFLFEVEEIPNVKVTRLSDEQREKNLKMLQFISRLAEERGIEFVMGIWQHRAWPFLQPSMVEGLSDENIAEYTRLALTKLLRLCPSIKRIQLRVNTESGIALSKQLQFYKDAVFRAMRESGRPVSLDLRGWGALPETIRAAEESGLGMRLSMKYWAEFMGPPYQPTEFPPAYCYADFLRYPRKYEVWYQVWSLGSHRLLLWGDPEYVKRFASSCHLGDSVGFEICAPLSQKGFGNEPGNWRIYTSPDLEYYEWEFERYWLFHLLFGRLSYNPQTSLTVWINELAKRFGHAAAPWVMKAYEHGSKVISYLVAYNLSNYNMYIWPEKRIGGLIDYYIETNPSDSARFYGIKEYVSSYLDDDPSAKITPKQVSKYLRTVADSCLKAVDEAKKLVGNKENKEFAATILDTEILSGLAQYHAEKALSGEQLAFFYATGDLWALDRSESYARRALNVWTHIVDLTEGVYHPRMVFGPGDIGHWKDNIVFVRHDVTRLKELQHLFEKYGNFDIGFDFGKRPETPPPHSQPITSNYSIERRFRGAYTDTVYKPQVGYGWLETKGLKPLVRAPSIPKDAWETLGLYSSTRLSDFRLYGNALYCDFILGTENAVFKVDLPNGLYDVTFIMKDEGDKDHGPMNITIQGREEVHSLRIPAGQLVEHRCRVEVSDGKLLVGFACEPGKDWILNGLTVKEVRPHIGHIPKRNTIPGEMIPIEATVTSPEEIRTVTLHYRRKESTAYCSLPMRRERRFCYATDVPKEKAEKGIVEYYLEAVDDKGSRTFFPARGENDPIPLVIGEDDFLPMIHHDKVLSCTPEKPLVISAQVQDNSGLRFVKLHYRSLNAFEKFKTVSMEFHDGTYKATIRASEIAEKWDLTYYVEAVNVLGNGAFYPDGEKETPYVVVKTH